MRRTMTAEVLQDYLSSAHMTVMLCRAHADFFHLDPEEVADAGWRIELHIAELENLRAELSANNMKPVANLGSNIIALPICG
jgi:hypothetical protein